MKKLSYSKKRKTVIRIIFDELNLKKQANELSVNVWQTPNFLFIVMGIIIIVAMTGVYVISNYYNSIEVLILSESIVVMVLFTIGNFIIKSVEEAAKSNKMKSEFISIASHQLKTPISEIKWEIELLLSKFSSGLSQKQSEIIEQISHSSRKMERLINDLLDVSRIDQKNMFLLKDKINMEKLIEEVIESQKELALFHDVEIKKSIKTKKSDVIADKRRIMVVLENLISNAIKYSGKKGKAEIILDKKGDMIQVVVRDNGVGIPKSEQVSIFEKFFRSNNSAKNRTDGTGLGLYIAKNIIEQSGGSIWFDSIENVGSEFYFLLPLGNKNIIHK